MAELHQKDIPLRFKLAKFIVFNNVKKALGLDQAKYLIYGAAPMAPAIRKYFLSLNIYLASAYGMFLKIWQESI